MLGRRRKARQHALQSNGLVAEIGRSEYTGTQQAEKLAVMSALSLYLNLVNIFQLLLNLGGEREG